MPGRFNIHLLWKYRAALLLLDIMKYRKLFYIITCFGLFLSFLITSCKKDTFITNSNALLQTSTDTLNFDTVFTSVGSVTQAFKIFNLNNQKLRLSSIQLMGGTNSSFKIDVDGSPGYNFSNIDMEASDSLYVFATVTINPNSTNLPFVVRDSIKIEYNGNTVYVQLQAYGRNARFLNNATVTKDTTWTNDLPIVVLGGLTVNPNTTLTINQGCNIYFHAGATMNVNGTLNAIGEKYDSTKIIFQGDRLDDPYNYYPGSWPGIVFSSTSKDNVLEYVTVKNAYNGVVVQSPSVNSNAKLTLNQCIITNASNIGIGGTNTVINATNCLISNCGSNVQLIGGGTYNFNQCTIASYQTLYITHKYPVLTISDADSLNNTYPLNFLMDNSIVYGESGWTDNEISISKQGSNTFNAAFNNVLYKVVTNPSNATFVNSIQNESPQFVTTDDNSNTYDFHLQSTSPCINKGLVTGVTIDLDGNPRDALPDIGCYEVQ